MYGHIGTAVRDDVGISIPGDILPGGSNTSHLVAK